MINDRLRSVILGVVTSVWASNFAAGLFVHDYKPNESINGIFMAIVGGVFIAGARKKDDDKDDDDHNTTREPPK